MDGAAIDDGHLHMEELEGQVGAQDVLCAGARSILPEPGEGEVAAGAALFWGEGRLVGAVDLGLFAEALVVDLLEGGGAFEGEVLDGEWLAVLIGEIDDEGILGEAGVHGEGREGEGLRGAEELLAGLGEREQATFWRGDHEVAEGADEDPWQEEERDLYKLSNRASSHGLGCLVDHLGAGNSMGIAGGGVRAHAPIPRCWASRS
jgi:hypothetical protein